MENLRFVCGHFELHFMNKNQLREARLVGIFDLFIFNCFCSSSQVCWTGFFFKMKFSKVTSLRHNLMKACYSITAKVNYPTKTLF